MTSRPDLPYDGWHSMNAIRHQRCVPVVGAEPLRHGVDGVALGLKDAADLGTNGEKWVAVGTH